MAFVIARELQKGGSVTTTYITIHGTGDGERLPSADSDFQWWRPGSPFCEELLAAVPGSSIEPFVWSGANEEHDRRQAAERLLQRLKRAEKAGEQIHLVGHSHGGSVTTLRYAAAERRKLPCVVAFTSIGTPFLRLRHKLLPWDRYDLIGRAALFFVLLGLAIAAFNAGRMWGGDLFVLGGLTTFSVGTAILYAVDRSRRGLHSRRLQRRFDSYFSDRWGGLSSSGDEAIGGTVPPTHFRLVTFFDPF